MRKTTYLWLGVFLISFFDLFSQDAFQEFKAKRKNVLEFTKKPEM